MAFAHKAISHRQKPHSFLPCRGVSPLLYYSVVSSTVATAIVRSSHGCYTLDQLFTSPAEQLLTYAIKELRIQRYGLLRLRGFPAQRTGDIVRCTLKNFRRGGEGEERHIDHVAFASKQPDSGTDTGTSYRPIHLNQAM